MKKITLLFAILFTAGLNSSQAQGPWKKKPDFGGIARVSAAGFSIGNKGYMGTGFTCCWNDYKDFWEYDPVTGAWTQKADFSGAARRGAVGFSVGGKGYIGTGWSGSYPDYVYYKDLWEYHPIANSWTKKADFGGVARAVAVGFSAGDKGYIGTGEKWDGISFFYNDFWEYDPATDTWTKRSNFEGTARSGAVGFSIDNKGYIGTGKGGGDPTLVFYNDFWEYDPATDNWTKRSDFGGTARDGAVGVSIGNKGYIGTGSLESLFVKDFWEYDVATDIWTRKADFGGTGRYVATGFSIGSKGYIGLGDDGGNTKDLWAYSPEVQTPGTWKVTGSMNTARAYFTATLLKNGKVLVTGGSNASNALASAELYDPATSTWMPTASMTVARSAHTATLLPSGKVLVAGGSTSIENVYSSAELYDPKTATWTPTGSMNYTRNGHIATLLSNGLVLVTGGLDENYVTRKSAELYDPNTGLWVKTGSMAIARTWTVPSLTTLPDGSILIVGGFTCCPYHVFNDAEIYNPTTQTWVPASSKATPAMGSTVLLPNGKVLVAGGAKGTQPNIVSVASAELLDPSTGTWNATASMSTRRNDYTLILLPNGQALAAGGGVCGGLTSELYVPGTGSWSPTGNMNVNRSAHTATVLPNGQVLVAGGRDCAGNISSNAELYTPSTCNGMTVYADADSDGYGNAADTLFVADCKVPGGYVNDSTDCDDTNPDINPGASETTGDGIDNNCNSQVDENNALSFDGVNDYVEIPNESTFDFTNAMTVEAWVKVSSFNKIYSSIVTGFVFLLRMTLFL